MSFSQWNVRIVQVLLAVIFLSYAADWVAMRVRMSRGTAFDSVQVRQFLATPLKGQKEEYDYNGDVPVTCSRSLYPQAGNNPCWWVRRHPTQWE